MGGRTIPTILMVANARLRKSLQTANASPFIAHHALAEPQKTEALAGVRQYVGGESSRIACLTRRFPALGTWCLATAVAGDYGANGDHAIYAPIARRFNVREIAGQTVRSAISAAFVAACRYLGLSLPACKTRLVDDYVLQAGVPESRLPAICTAFFQAESLYGLPSVEDTQSLNAWEDRAADLAPVGLTRLRQILWHDESAWHALVFCRLRHNGVTPGSPFEQAMQRAIGEARQSGRVSRQRGTPEAKPLLRLDDDDMAIAVPEGGTAFDIMFGGRRFRLRRGGTMRLPPPWPDAVDYAARSGDGEKFTRSLPLWPPGRVVLVFDAEDGHRLQAIDRQQQGGRVVIDAPEAAFVSRWPFRIGDQAAYARADGAFLLYASPGQRTRLTVDGMNVDIRPSNRPTVTLEAERVARNREGWLYGRPRGVRISIPQGTMPGDGYTVDITHPAFEGSITADFRDGESISIDLEDEPLAAGEPVVGPLRVDLRSGKSDRSFVRARFFVWPDLERLRDGTIFDAPRVPGNFSAAHSRHVTVDACGQICLSPEEAFRQASLAFVMTDGRANKRILDFVVPRPGVTAAIESADGTERMLGPEAVVYVSDATADTLVIHTDDITNRLEVCGVRETLPSFGRSGVRRLPLIALDHGGGTGWVRIFRAGNLPLDVVRLEKSTAPRHVEVSGTHAAIRLQIEAAHEIDAVRVQCRDLSSPQSLTLERALRSIPVDARHWDILEAGYLDATCSKLEVCLDKSRLSPGIWIGEASARRAAGGAWYRLESAGGGRFILGLQTTAPDPDALVAAGRHVRCFDALTDILNTGIDPSCWPSARQVLRPMWRKLGAMLRARPDGKRLLLRACGFGTSPGSSPARLPVYHPVRLVPDLFEAPAYCFRDYPVGGDDALAGPGILNAVSEIDRVRQAARTIPVTGLFFAGFANFAAAHSDDRVRLSGFRFAEYRKAIEQYSIHEFGIWRPGSEMLTARHHAWALSRFADRLLQVSPEGSGVNRNRLPAAARVMRESGRVSDKAFLPAGKDSTSDLHIVEDAPAFFSLLARCSRAGQSGVFWNELGRRCERGPDALATDVGLLVRLGPELFAFYLVLWELVEISKRER